MEKAVASDIAEGKGSGKRTFSRGGNIKTEGFQAMGKDTQIVNEKGNYMVFGK